MNIKELFREVENEIEKAIAKYPVINSLHQGYAIILEEVDELWDEVKKKQGTRNSKIVREECIQIAAMALRTAYDLEDYDFQK